MKSIDSLPKFLNDISQDIHQLGGEAYLVGGWVRDLLLGEESKDFDVEVYGLNEHQLLNLLGRYGRASSVGKSFGVFIIQVGKIHYDFSFPRTEVKIGEGHRGFEVHPDPNLDFTKASSRRDFTINAMGFNLITHEIIDPQNGRIDLQKRVLRHVGPAFGEDPLRVLRGIQFIARFNLNIVPETIAICRQQDLSELSVERFEEEFKKLLLKGKYISQGLSVIGKMGLLRFFPEMKHITSQDLGQKLNHAHEFLILFQEERDKLVFMYSLMTMGLDQANFESFMARFTQDVKLLKGIQNRRQSWKIYQARQTSPQGISPISAGVIRRIAIHCPIYEFLPIQSLLESTPEQILQTKRALSHQKILAFSDIDDQAIHTIHTSAKSLELIQSAKRWKCLQKRPTAWYQGRDLIEMGFKPSPQFGKALQECFELQLDEFFRTKEAAAKWLQDQLS